MREAGAGFLRPRGVPLPAGDGQRVQRDPAGVLGQGGQGGQGGARGTLDWIIEQTACCRAAVKDT